MYVFLSSYLIFLFSDYNGFYIQMQIFAIMHKALFPAEKSFLYFEDFLNIL